jgi:hypothetical protein
VKALSSGAQEFGLPGADPFRRPQLRISEVCHDPGFIIELVVLSVITHAILGLRSLAVPE